MLNMNMNMREEGMEGLGKAKVYKCGQGEGGG